MRTRDSANDAAPIVAGQSTPGPAATGKIAFYSGRDGNEEIYVANADGSGQTRLSNSPCEDDVLA
jgi:hypothetical protein